MSTPTTGYTIGGAASGTVTSPLPVASTIDGVNDYIPIYTNSLTATQAINRNTFLNLASGPVGLTDSQTLTNKTITSPTISSPTFSGTTAGTFTIGGTVTFPSTVVSTTGTQTLTNKTLTSPTINSPTITNATITADTISGYTTANTGSIYGISVAAGVITTANSIGSGALQTNAILANNLAANAITLGYAPSTSPYGPTSVSSYTQVTGLTVNVTIPAGGRKVKITAFCGSVLVTAGPSDAYIGIWDGTVGSGTQLAETHSVSGTANYPYPHTCVAVVTPAAGSKTYNVGVKAGGAGTTVTIAATATTPTFILVEAI